MGNRLLARQLWIAYRKRARQDVWGRIVVRHRLWGRPPGLRGTPPSRSRNNNASRPTGASAADQGVCPTIPSLYSASLYKMLMLSYELAMRQIGRASCRERV